MIVGRSLKHVRGADVPHGPMVSAGNGGVTRRAQLDRELPAFHSMFLYMPFMHTKRWNPASFRRLFERLATRLVRRPYSYAATQRLVERFGRSRTGTISWPTTTPDEAGSED